MRFENNFRPLDELRLMDESLKVYVESYRFNLDDSTRYFWIYHDPEFRPEGMWLKLPDEEIQLRIRSGMPRPKDDLSFFISPTRTKLTSFGLSETMKGDELLLVLTRDERGYYAMRNHVARENAGAVSDYPDEFIDYVIHAMPQWYSSKTKTPCHNKTPRRVKFLVDLTFARHLPSYKETPFEEDDAGNIVFAKQEIV
jgi:hypothetical protein